MKLLRLLVRDAERLCEASGASITFPTRVGYKTLNRLNHHRIMAAFEGATERDVAPDTLRLGFDALRDPYTLVGRPLAESPHLELVAALDRGVSPRHTEYAGRLEAGTLSQGLPVRFDEQQVRRQFAAREREIAADVTQRVQTVAVNGSRYILDGKHRAAHSLLRGAPVDCVDFTRIIFDSEFRYVYYVRPSRQAARFAKHLDVLGPAYERAASTAAPLPVTLRA